MKVLIPSDFFLLFLITLRLSCVGCIFCVSERGALSIELLHEKTCHAPAHAMPHLHPVETCHDFTISELESDQHRSLFSALDVPHACDGSLSLNILTDNSLLMLPATGAAGIPISPPLRC
jgi:hypothetical protein